MGVTRADVELKGRILDRRSITRLALSNGLGLAAFALCLIAESTKTQVVLVESNMLRPCMYTRTGYEPLLCSCGALIILAMALSSMLGKASPDDLLQPLDLWTSSTSQNLHWQASICLVTSWTFFAVASALLLIGGIVEAGHVFNQGGKHMECLVVGQGLFVGAGIFSLTSITLISAFYIVALHATLQFRRQRHVSEQEYEERLGIERNIENSTISLSFSDSKGI